MAFLKLFMVESRRTFERPFRGASDPSRKFRASEVAFYASRLLPKLLLCHKRCLRGKKLNNGLKVDKKGLSTRFASNFKMPKFNQKQKSFAVQST